MKLQKSVLAAAVAGALALGASGQAAASVYAGSRLLVQDFRVIVTEDGTNPAPNVTINGFQFTATNTATLNGVSDVTQTAQCGGTPGAPPSGNNCSTVLPRLDPNPANAPGGNLPGGERLNNNFSFFGTSAFQYSNSDSVIDKAELTLDGPTSTRQIAESEIQLGTSASSNAEIQSTTGFSFTFTISGAANNWLIVTFEADPNLMVAINQLPQVFVNGSAQANLNETLRLTNDSTGDQLTWSPQGTPGTNNCDVDTGFAVTCVETADSVDLNRNLSVSTNPNTVVYSDNRPSANPSPDLGFQSFGILVAGLSDGQYTFALNTVTSTQLRQTVPEPMTLALLGVGLLGIGATARRKLRA